MISSNRLAMLSVNISQFITNDLVRGRVVVYCSLERI